jgi:RAP1 GTPase activating protein 1
VNLVGRDGENGPVLVSVKAETVAGQEHWRVLLRLRAGSTHDLVPAANLTSNPTPSKMVKVKATRFMILSGSEKKSATQFLAR